MQQKNSQGMLSEARMRLFQYQIPLFMQSMLAILTDLTKYTLHNPNDVVISKQLQCRIVERLECKDYLYAVELLQYELLALYQSEGDVL